ncbi:MAG TPA: FAD/NAD(P)-binding oxidoreductase [Gemmatimonadaceae bacterium]|nr:FAD/NAD(P)-binding oxidoreductase [Gemmatimonadaceae bacterium]
MTARVLVLGAGCGGLELATRLSERFGGEIDVTLIERADAFVFGFSKLDILFGRKTLLDVAIPYRGFAKPGVRFVHDTVTSIDPWKRRVMTAHAMFEADFVVIALGADMDVASTPGLGDVHEFFSVAGAVRARDAVRAFTRGHAVIGVCGLPYKCPPAPSECALLLHDDLVTRGVRDACTITLVVPTELPVPPSNETSEALVSEFRAAGVSFVCKREIVSIDRADGAQHAVRLDDGRVLRCDLFLGVPRHRAPRVVEASGLTREGWIPVDRETLETDFENVFAIGDVAETGSARAGVFAESAAKSVASSLIARIERTGTPEKYEAAGSCYLEFGGGRVATVDMNFFGGAVPTGAFHAPTSLSGKAKERYATERRERWLTPPGVTR